MTHHEENLWIVAMQSHFTCSKRAIVKTDVQYQATEANYVSLNHLSNTGEARLQDSRNLYNPLFSQAQYTTPTTLIKVCQLFQCTSVPSPRW